MKLTPAQRRRIARLCRDTARALAASMRREIARLRAPRALRATPVKGTR